MKLYNKTMEKNLRVVVFSESLEFLKEKSKVVLEILTKSHRRLVLQLIEFRRQTKEKMNEYEQMRSIVMKKEMTSVFSAPVAEAEYQIKRRDTIGFYDCLKPRLKVRGKRKRTNNENGSNFDDLAELL